jgi:hypothetical protein
MFIILKIKIWLTCKGRFSGACFNSMDKCSFARNLLEDEQDLSVGEMLTVNSCTPNIYITLWFELDYGTNPPLDTLIIWQVQLCMCIWKCCVFAGKHGLKGRSHNEFEGANKEFHSCLSARWNHSQRWKGPCAMTDHPQGLRRKDGTSCEKTHYIDRGDDDAKMTHLKVFKYKMIGGSTRRRDGRTGPKWAQTSQPRQAGPPHSCVSLPPFLEREDSSTLGHSGFHHSEETEWDTREAVHKEERLDGREIIHEKDWLRPWRRHKWRRTSRPCHSALGTEGRHHRKHHHDQRCHDEVKFSFVHGVVNDLVMQSPTLLWFQSINLVLMMLCCLKLATVLFGRIDLTTPVDPFNTPWSSYV